MNIGQKVEIFPNLENSGSDVRGKAKADAED